jgi:hypothetical protein
MNYIKFDKFGQRFDLDDIKSIGIREYDVVVVCESGLEVSVYSANTIFEASYIAEQFISDVIKAHKQERKQ